MWRGVISFLLCIIISCIDDIRGEHLVVTIHHVDEVVFICVLEGDEVGIHEALDETCGFVLGVLSFVMLFLFESRVWVNAEVT